MGLISYLFGLMFLIVPLIFFPKTSELFEFNKMIAIYIFTILISSAWVIDMIRAKKIIFKRTLLDIPILIYLGTSLISTIFSIDVHTSIFGYYGRFNGGFLSLLSYAVLYWAFVSNITKKSMKYIVYSILGSAVIVSVYGIFEHFGHSFSCLVFTGSFDDSCWVQDVQTRVFATLGQPNWLAAYLVALLPLAIYNLQFKKKQLGQLDIRIISNLVISLSILLAIWFTKSRSGFLGLGAAMLVFIGLVLWKKSRELAIGFCILAILVGSILGTKLLGAKSSNTGSGGTDSGEIRQLVWAGAIEVWQHYPIFGSGLETFAYTFPKFRPVAHNLTSEWDFVYNKAHNEYLNQLATTGAVGFIAYILLIFFAILQISNAKLLINVALLAGYVSILITNFFGFSVVVTQLFLFLLPAIAVVASSGKGLEVRENEYKQLNNNQKLTFAVTLVAICYLLFAVSRYWYADYLYAQSKTFSEEKKYSESTHSILSAISISPSEAVYHDELSGQLAHVAVLLKDENATDSAEFALRSDDEGKITTSLSFYNVPLRKARIRDLLILSDIDKNYLTETIPFIEETKYMDAPDPYIYLEEGKAYVKLGEIDTAINSYKKAVELKTNYQDARYALGILYKIKKDYKNAKIQFQYILDNLSPNDEVVKKEIKSF